jgi:hypothetical protein
LRYKRRRSKKMTKKVVKIERILAVELLAERKVEERGLMCRALKQLSLAIQRGDTINIPLHVDTDGRIPGVVETLRDWLGRGIICYGADVDYEVDAAVGIYFTVINRHFLEQVVEDQKCGKIT